MSFLGLALVPHTREMPEWLEWRGCDFVEYDVERDRAASVRMRMVPLLIEDGKVVQSGWQARGCVLGEGAHA